MTIRLPLHVFLFLATLVVGAPSAARVAHAAPVLIEATSLTLRDDVAAPVDARKRKLVFRSSTSRAAAASRIVPPSPGAADDPTLAGATLYVANAAGSGEIARIALPSSGWTAQGTASRPRGYRFTDRSPGAVVPSLTIAPDRISLRASGESFVYTLDEPQQGRIALRLDLGGASWCTEAPARATGNPPSTASNDAPGRFTAQAKSSPPALCTLNRLTVGNGYGSGTYPAGSTVHVFAAVQPQSQLVTGWTGDTSLLAEPDEWHTTLVMPAADASVAATIASRPTTLAVTTFTGSTTRAKTVRAKVPPGARGLVLLLHGTNGGDGFILQDETFAVALRLLEAGYGVLGTEAEESVAGDLNGDGKKRWDAGLTTANVDFANLDALIAALRAAGTIGPTTPLFVLGMSNGGSTSLSLGAVAASPVAASFPNLRFAAVISFCADGRATAAAITTTPTAWLMCGNDDNPEVDNAAAAVNSAGLAARGIPTAFALHPAAPLYDERFARVAGVSAATSRAIAAELRAAGFLAADGFFTLSTDDLVAAVTATPSLLPTLVALSGAQKSDVIDQVRAAQAEHQMYSDWAARAVAFFDAHGS
ncbi:hypothetical protein K2Z84_10190 [Candidatus Binatia bacterium]|nr:hypothetical protein [Candidatus Binatia bacterium]